MSSPIFSAKESETPSSIGRRKDAVELFELYGIPRPDGWLSEGDRRQRQLSETIHICHSCGKHLQSRKSCSNCGHEFCRRCTTEKPGTASASAEISPRDKCETSEDYSTLPCDSGEEGTDLEDFRPSESIGYESEHPVSSDPDDGLSTPKAPVTHAQRLLHNSDQHSDRSCMSLGPGQKSKPAVSGLVKGNPFYMADRGPRLPVPDARSTRATRPRRMSDCVPRRHMNRSDDEPPLEKTCSNPACQAARDERRPERQCICCAPRQGLGRRRTAGDLGQNSSSAEERDDSSSTERISPACPPRRATNDSHDRSLATTEPEEAVMSSFEKDYPLQGEQPTANPSSFDYGDKAPMASPRSHHSRERDDRPEISDTENVPQVSTPRLSRRMSEKPSGSRSMDPIPHTDRDLARPLISSSDEDGSSIVASPQDLKSASFRSLHKKYGEAPKLDPERLKGMANKSTSNLSRPRLPMAKRPKARVTTVSAESTGARTSPTTSEQHIAYSEESNKFLHPKEAKGSPRPHLRRVSSGLPDRSELGSNSTPFVPRSLRKADRAESKNITEGPPSPSAWRQQLKPSQMPRASFPEKKTSPTAPASAWRQNLNKTPHTPRSHPGKRRETCSFCDPSHSSSVKSKGRGTHPSMEDAPALSCDHLRAPDYIELTRESLTPPGLRVRQVERSLAHKSSSEPPNKDPKGRERTQSSPLRKRRDSKGTGHRLFPTKTDTTTNAQSSRNSLPSERSCSWRTRLNELSSELEQLKSEPRSDRDVRGSDIEGIIASLHPSRSNGGCGEGCGRRNYDDFGIEGLTIIIHMRHKDDLVINTDLKGEGALFGCG